MRHRIASAVPHADLTIDLAWSNGRHARIDFRPIIGKGGVLAPLLDPAFFCGCLAIADEGRCLAWSGDLEFSADGLLYRAFPELAGADVSSPSAAE